MNHLLALDIDDTIIPWACKTKQCRVNHENIVHELLDFCDQHGVEYALNTARSYKSFEGIPPNLIKRFIGKSYCYRPIGSSDVPTHKIKCMRKLAKKMHSYQRDQTWKI